jgi:hypothetical protein
MGNGNLIFITKDGAVTETPYRAATSLPWLANLTIHGQDVLLLLAAGAHDLTLIDLKQGFTGVNRTPSIEQAGMIPIAGYHTYVGPRWSTIMNCFIGLDYALVTPTLLFLTPSNPKDLMGSSWAWTREVIQPFGGAILNPANDRWSRPGCWGRLVECVPLRSLVWTKDEMSKGQLIRPRGMA